MTTDPDSGEDEVIETYAGAPDSLVEIWMQRRNRLMLAARDFFPAADIDLGPLLVTRIPADLPPLEGRRPARQEAASDADGNLPAGPNSPPSMRS